MKQGKRKLGASDKHATTLEQEMNDEFMSERSFKTKSVKTKIRQDSEEFVDSRITSRILREARNQQQEIEREKDKETGAEASRNTFTKAAMSLNSKPGNSAIESDSEDNDDFAEEDLNFSDGESQYEEQQMDEVTEEDERAVAVFMSADAVPQKTLADVIMARIRQREDDAGIANSEERIVPGLDSKVSEVYKGVGELMRRFTSGKVPKAFKIIPSLSNWEDVLYLTHPEQWSPSAMFVATRLFASNLNAAMAQRFFSLVLLPRVRQDIRSQKRLHFALYQSIKKALYKPSAFYKGFLLPLCQSRTCSLREAFIVGSALQKVSIPVLHSSVALMKIAQMGYSGTNSYFMKILLDKKYALPYRVLDAVMNHFVRFVREERVVPVIWHQCLLTFVQRYKNELQEEDHESLKRLMKYHRHYLMTPEIHRELANSSGRGRGGDKPGSNGASRVSVKGVGVEDYKNLPDVKDMMDEE